MQYMIVGKMDEAVNDAQGDVGPGYQTAARVAPAVT